MKILENTEEKKKFDQTIVKAKKAWFDSMESYQTSYGTVDLPHPAPMLSEDHINDCVLLPNRLAVLDRMKKGGVVAEIGVQNGEFSQIILDICNPSELHLIDLDLPSHINNKFDAQIRSGVIKVYEGDSSTIMGTYLPANYFDFVYIDGDHRYDGVRRDIEAVKQRLKPGGFLIFNDYTYWSPVECMPYGVIQAVNELCLDENWQMKYFALAHFMYCDVALQKPHLAKKSGLSAALRRLIESVFK